MLCGREIRSCEKTNFKCFRNRCQALGSSSQRERKPQLATGLIGITHRKFIISWLLINALKYPVQRNFLCSSQFSNLNTVLGVFLRVGWGVFHKDEKLQAQGRKINQRMMNFYTDLPVTGHSQGLVAQWLAITSGIIFFSWILFDFICVYNYYYHHNYNNLYYYSD